MLESRAEDHKKIVEDEFERLKNFLDADIPEPEIEASSKRIPHYGDPHHKVTINPLTPKFFSEHEARHAAQEATILELGSEFPDEMKDFYESELEDLEPSWDMRGMENRIRNILPIGSRLEDISEAEDNLDKLGPYGTATLVSDKNYLTSNQPEVWASDGYLVPETIQQVALGIYWGNEPSEIVDKAEYVAKASEWWLDTQTNNLGLFSPEVSNQEMGALLGISAMHFAKNAVAYGVASTALYETLRSEPLKESNLAHLETEDRKRAMLYNDEVEEGIDEFLDVLGGYGIE